MKTIFVVSVLKWPLSDCGEDWPVRCRTWGWYEEVGEAQRAVLENRTDIFESLYYDTAVIEAVGEGVMAEPIPQGWYRASSSGGDGNDAWLHPKVISIETPNWAVGHYGWGIG